MVFDGDLPTGDLHPISSCPCWAYTRQSSSQPSAAGFATLTAVRSVTCLTWLPGVTMTEYEMMLLINEYMSTLNQFTEFWITISFAVVVAATYAPSNLGANYSNMLFYGYLAVSIILVCGRTNWLFAIYKLSQRVIDQGYPYPGSSLFGSVAGAGIFLMMFFGTIGVLFYTRKAIQTNISKNT